MNELNPNHPVTREIHSHWHNIAALLLIHSGKRRIVVTMEDVEKLEGQNIVIHARTHTLEVYLVDDAAAQRLARQEGGLPA